MNEMNELVLNKKHSKDKRKDIIHAAEEIFGKHGFKNSKITQIARRANIATGTIYEYFEDKEDLFFSIVTEKCEEFDGELDINLSGIKNVFERIRKYVWFYLHFFQKYPVYTELLMLEMRTNKRFHKSAAYSWIKKSNMKIITMIEEGQSQGVIREDVDPYTIRHLLLGSLEHIATRWVLKERSYDMLPYSESIADLVIEAISIKSKQ